MQRRIYLDHAATTPLRPEAREAMAPYLGAEAFGNPSSLHAEGQRAKRALDEARERVASSLGAEFSEIAFTGGGSEADNMALVGVMLANRARGNHLVVSAIEHEAVLRTAAFLEGLGFEASYVIPDGDGVIEPDAVARALRPETVLVSVMHANNEIGTIQPVREIAAVAHAAGAWFHTDAVQSYGQIDVDVKALGVDLLAVSAHKIYGPKGVGALYVRDGVPIESLIHGGGQERERRAGTENVAGIAGFAEAVRWSQAEKADEAARITVLRDRFIQELMAACPECRLNGDAQRRLPGNVNVSFPGRDAETMLLALDMAGIAASSGSACTSGSIEPSHVLQALGLSDTEIGATIRFSLGRSTTEEDVLETVRRVREIVARLDAGK